jgi:CheY-like chemotaxis protein
MEQLARLRPATILVVENEAIVLLELADWLEDVGFTVLTAFSADEALGLLRLHPEVGLLMTDISMPGSMDGLELAHLANKSWPRMKIIVTSGRTNPQLDELPDGSVFIPKPLERLRLRGVLDRLTGDAPPPDTTAGLPG